MKPEPQRKDFVTEAAYRAVLEAWLQDVEKEGDNQLEELFEQHQKEQ